MWILVILACLNTILQIQQALYWPKIEKRSESILRHWYMSITDRQTPANHKVLGRSNERNFLELKKRRHTYPNWGEKQDKKNGLWSLALKHFFSINFLSKTVSFSKLINQNEINCWIKSWVKPKWFQQFRCVRGIVRLSHKLRAKPTNFQVWKP